MSSATAVSVPRLYRSFLQVLRSYPSSKRAAYIVACKEEFRDTGLSEAEYNLRKEMAVLELSRLRKYTGVSDHDTTDDFEVHL